MYDIQKKQVFAKMETTKWAACFMVQKRLEIFRIQKFSPFFIRLFFRSTYLGVFFLSLASINDHIWWQLNIFGMKSLERFIQPIFAKLLCFISIEMSNFFLGSKMQNCKFEGKCLVFTTSNGRSTRRKCEKCVSLREMWEKTRLYVGNTHFLGKSHQQIIENCISVTETPFAIYLKVTQWLNQKGQLCRCHNCI